jgi:hypothetical protein
MTLPLTAALRAAAEGLYALEAATGLIIAHGTWLARDDFARFIHQGTGRAAIDWVISFVRTDRRCSADSTAVARRGRGSLFVRTDHGPPGVKVASRQVIWPDLSS